MRHPRRPVASLLCVFAALALLGGKAFAQSSFVNWETPHVHPLDLTPDRTRLLAVNTADARLEIFDVTGATPVAGVSIAVGLDPVSVRARSNREAWVVNHVSDSISIVDLHARSVVRTLATEDEPADVVFASNRAFVTCSQADSVLVFDTTNLAAAPVRLEIFGQDPRALAVSPDGSKVYAAIFESGNGSTVLGGGLAVSATLAFPPNVVSQAGTPYNGQNPPPNAGSGFNPPQNAANGAPPPVGLIVKKDAGGAWRDDNQQDWTPWVSGANAAQSGRRVGWDLPDNDVAVIDVAALTVSYARRSMNLCMALAVNPASGELLVVGTDATNEIRFEPLLNGVFLRVRFARFPAGGAAAPSSTADLNPHLDYSTPTLPQPERDRSLGDPRGIVFRADGQRGYVSGMGSNNVVVVDGQGARVGLRDTIAVGEGPTGLALHESAARLYVLDKFEAAISVIDTTLELEIARVPFHDASPAAIRTGRKHLYDTRKNSGLGQVACASCHADARFDRLAWDLGDPSASNKPVTGQNLGGNFPGLNTGFLPFHAMKGPMTTQTLQDIIGKEPHHWRGDRDGIEQFAPAFLGLQGDDETLDATEMQEFEDFLATIAFPPNPYRNFDNSLPTNLPLTGHFTTGRFSPAGQPLPNGNAQNGLAMYRPPRLLDGGLACVTCHTLPTGMGTDYRFLGGPLQPFPVGPKGEHHHMLVSVDGTTNISMKVPHLRNLYEKVGFNTTQLSNSAGVGLLHDGSIDSIERFLSEPAFSVVSDQEVADLTAFMLAFSGSDLPAGSTTNLLEPPGSASQDTHAAVGRQSTLSSLAGAPPAQIALLDAMKTLAVQQRVGLIAKSRQASIDRGYRYVPVGDSWQSDRAAEVLGDAAFRALASTGSEITFTVVPRGSETRLGIDRDLDGTFDRDEWDAGTDPADPASQPGGCTSTQPAAPSGLNAQLQAPTQIALGWNDNSNDEDGFQIERSTAGTGLWTPVGAVAANVVAFVDSTATCDGAFEYRVRAFNCAGGSGTAHAAANAGPCCPTAVAYCTAKVNSLGCTPAISGQGTPSATASSGFVVRSVNMRNNKAGLLFYSNGGRAASPFTGGTLCVGGALKRVQGLSSGGTPSPVNDCSGVFSVDVNAFRAGLLGGNPNAFLSVVGTVVTSQFWGRDPGFTAPDNTQLSDGLEFTICP